jgi:hypothetical protein
MEQDIAPSIGFKRYALDILQETALLFLGFQLEGIPSYSIWIVFLLTHLAVHASAESTNAARTQEEIRKSCTIMRIIAPTVIPDRP